MASPASVSSTDSPTAISAIPGNSGWSVDLEGRAMRGDPGRSDFLYTTIHAPNTSPLPVCRPGLARPGNTHLCPDDILVAIDRGINFLNWCGIADGLSTAISALGARRREVVVCVQFEARTAADAERELAAILTELNTNYV